MKRITECFQNKKVLIAYLMAGDGGIEHTKNAAFALIKGKVDMLEIGVPFSDPIADGPVIAESAHRAISHATTMKEVLHLVSEIRAFSDIPIILFSYLNPILSYLKKNKIKDLSGAGLDGVLLLDCPIDESKQLRDAFIDHDLASIYIITPNTSISRMQEINHYGKGFLYYACRPGVTGMKASLPEDFEEKMQVIHENVTLPVAVGFGISTNNMVQDVWKHAEGVVIGSLFVKALAENISMENLTHLAKSMRVAV